MHLVRYQVFLFGTGEHLQFIRPKNVVYPHDTLKRVRVIFHIEKEMDTTIELNILQTVTSPWTEENTQPRWVLMQSNIPSHTTKLAMQCSTSNKIQVEGLVSPTS
ncbi:hypothetical protein Trydic_g11028 [Trypoxylus dichotomus]